MASQASPLRDDAVPPMMEKFRERVVNEGVRSYLVSLLGVVGSARAHYAHMLLALCVAGGYVYLSIVPPAQVVQICKSMHLPAWMGNVMAASCAAVLCFVVARGQIARKIIFSDSAALARCLSDPAPLEDIAGNEVIRSESESESNPWRHCPMTLITSMLGLVALAAVVQDGWVITVLAMPLCIATAGLNLPSVLVAHTLQEISKSKASALHASLQKHLDIDVLSGTTSVAPQQELSVQFWREMTKRHQELDRDLEMIWSLRHGGALLLADLTLRGFFVAEFFTLAVLGSESVAMSVICVAVMSFTIFTMLNRLLPLAHITRLCQSRCAGDESILRSAALFLNSEHMEADAQDVHARFMLALNSTPVGIELPGVGLLTVGMLANYAKICATATPVAITYLFNAVGQGDSKSC